MRKVFPVVSHLILCKALVGLDEIRTYIEIGVSDGGSLRRVVREFPGLQEIILCDTWGDQYGGTNRGNHNHIELLLREEGFSLDKAAFLDGESKKQIPQYFSMYPDKTVDLCLIDADHSGDGLWGDLVNISAHAKIIAAHDIRHMAHLYLRDVFYAFYETMREEFIAIDAGCNMGLLFRHELFGC